MIEVLEKILRETKLYSHKIRGFIGHKFSLDDAIDSGMIRAAQLERMKKLRPGTKLDVRIQSSTTKLVVMVVEDDELTSEIEIIQSEIDKLTALIDERVGDIIKKKSRLSKKLLNLRLEYLKSLNKRKKH